MSDNGEKPKSVAEVHTNKGKPKYEPPTVFSLGGPARGTGQLPPVPCSVGSSPMGGICVDGSLAGNDCNTGTGFNF